MSADRLGRAVNFIVLLGAVSLFADTTYEGARSVAGPFSGMLPCEFSASDARLALRVNAVWSVHQYARSGGRLVDCRSELWYK